MSYRDCSAARRKISYSEPPTSRVEREANESMLIVCTGLRCLPAPIDPFSHLDRPAPAPPRGPPPRHKREMGPETSSAGGHRDLAPVALDRADDGLADLLHRAR